MLILVRKLEYLAAGDRRWPWFLLIGLALVVSAIEGIGAILIFGLLAITTDPTGAIELPLVGNVRAYLGEGDTERVLITAAIIVVVFFVVRALVVIGMTYVQARVTQSAGARLASRLLQGYLAMPYVLAVNTNSAQQIRNVQVTVPLVVADAFVYGARMASESIAVAVLSLLLVATSPLGMVLFLVLVGPAVLVVSRLVRPRLQQLGRATQDLSGESLQVLQESIHGLREIRVHRREAHFASVFASIRYGLAQTSYRRTVLTNLPSIALETVLVLAISALLVITTLSDARTSELLPVLGMFAYVGFRLKPSLTQLVEGWNAVRYAAASIDDLYGDLRRSEAWIEIPDSGDQPFPFDRTIRLEGVTFRYPESSTSVLTDVDLLIQRGTSVGFVGPTGGGKSTLLDVIIGLLEPQEGSVLVDGIDIRTMRRGWWRRLGIVPQTVFLMDASVRRNVALGVPENEIDDGRVLEVLRLAKLDEFVGGLPAGVDSMLGERGARLSGGQRQRVAIARALYRDPDVFVLDEGTAALDNRTEAELMRSLEVLHGRCTLLIVAHRLSTVRNCDVVHVIRGGRVVASGTYDELLEVSADFKDLTT